MRCKIVYFLILLYSALHVQLLAQKHYGDCSWIFRAFSVSAVALRAYSFFTNAYWKAVPVHRDLNPTKNDQKIEFLYDV